MSVGLALNVDKNKNFFDREAVKKALGAKNAAILGRFGSFVKNRARQSMRRRKKPSPPGTPPSAHSGKGFPKGPLLKTLMRHEWDPTTKSVVIGPKGQSGKLAPSLQEFGGDRIIRYRPSKVGPSKICTPAQKAAYHRKCKDGSIVVEKRPLTTKTIHLPKRPYMKPALLGELPKFPTLYAGQITG